MAARSARSRRRCRVIGFLNSETPADTRRLPPSFRQGLSAGRCLKAKESREGTQGSLCARRVALIVGSRRRAISRRRTPGRHTPALPGDNARKVRTLRQKPENIGSHRTAWWARQDSFN